MKNNIELEQVLNAQLKSIGSILENKYHENSHLGVLAGTSGMSLFHFYYSKYLDQDFPSDIGFEILSKSIDRINNGYGFPTYCSGIAGAGWVFDHLVEEGFIEMNTDDLLPDLDEYLYNKMISDLNDGHYDFLHGAIGYGFYFLKRFKNTKSQALKERYINYLLSFLTNLAKLSEKDKNGLKWTSVLDIETGLQGYNLSLSHGMSSIINFLSRLHEYEEFKDSVSPILIGAITYLSSFENLDKNAFSLFPSRVTDPMEDTKSRLAWCYGDLGIGLSLRIAAKTLEDDMLYEMAIGVLKHASNRKTIEQSLVKDAGLCHGSYGNAQIFNRLYRETKEIVFRESAEYWIEEGVARATFKDGYAGYKQWYGPDKSWKSETNFLTGIAGIGMAIIFHLSDFETTWDECLMIG
ncbi:lanthionine synthetase C family protein [Aquimarina gracilis]|uniref:Lanthionine synthetase C family protein n=1 Tax=Aquimarina gracilis TaxID=874422 RepID=A0ABU6A014_9FLAO|nr:lanthionine synthetase C family protein [Aquimarina gracilis]MEB3347474.1 lanthionine synthetase C family protein [Aquimarina gracilis]